MERRLPVATTASAVREYVDWFVGTVQTMDYGRVTLSFVIHESKIVGVDKSVQVKEHLGNGENNI